MIGERIAKYLTGVSAPARWFLDWAGVSPTASGVTVSEQTALTYSAVWAATRILSETIASLPLKVYRRLPGNCGREEARSHPLYGLLHDVPNANMDTFSFRETQTASLVNWGNAYAEIYRLGNNHICQLMPLHPGCVEPKWDNEKQEVYYVVRDEPHRSPRIIFKREMWHTTGTLSEEGIVGKGVIRQARESIGMGMATERYGAAFFGNGARPGGVIEHPGQRPLSTEAANNLRDQWEKMHQGVANSHRVAILREGATYKTIGIPPEEAQFLETRMHNISEIARWYRLPPHLLADLSHATFTNIEHESLNFVKYSVMPWLRRIECSINRQLLGGSDKYYAEFVVDGLLRGDKKTRTEASVMEFMHGKKTLNQWRQEDNENPVNSKYGDEHFVPLNLVPLDKIEEHLDKKAQPRQQPQSQPEQPPNPKSAPEKPKNNAALLAAEDALNEAESRMLAIEIKAIKRAAKRPNEFLTKVDEFYQKHHVTMVKAVLPLRRVLCALRDEGAEKTEWLVGKVLDTRREQVCAACECLPTELENSIEQLTNKWLSEPDNSEVKNAENEDES